MSNPSITIRDADEESIDRIEAVLEANGLPHQDVRQKPECFFAAYSDGEFIGTGGVETYGSDGLLRSLVITESNRGHGFGATLCAALEDYARTCEVDRLYLLTSTAEAFFGQRGYETTAREDAPARIQQTTEFTDLCSNSATCMRKTL